MVSVFVRPREKSARQIIYMNLSEEEKAKIKEVAFLPKSAYPPLKGRPPKYDFLQVIVSPITQERGEEIREYLRETLGRDVYAVRRVKEKGKETWFYFLPWRDPRTGKALPNKRWFFQKLRTSIKELAEKGHTNVILDLSAPAKKSSEEESGSMGPSTKETPPRVRAESEEIITTPTETTVKDQILAELEALEEIHKRDTEKKKQEIKREMESIKRMMDGVRREIEYQKKRLRSLEMRGRFAPGYLSNKRQIKKRIAELNEKMAELEREYKKLKKEYSKVAI